MNSKLMKASLAGAAAIAIAAGGSTFAAFSDFGNIDNNSAAAGILKLDLADGTGATGTMDFQKMFPGDNAPRFVWIASSDKDSAPNANLSVTLHNLRNLENGCSSESESTADPTCGAANDPGELSKVVNVQTQYYPAAKTSGQCNASLYPGQGNYQSIWTADGLGDLDTYTTGAGTTWKLKDSVDPSKLLVLKPGDGVCIGVDVYWPHDEPSYQTTPDNAAQGDSVKFDMHFDLTQV